MIDGLDKFLEEYGSEIKKPIFCVLDAQNQNQNTIEKFKEYKQISDECAQGHFILDKDTE